MGRQRRNIHINDNFLEAIKTYHQTKMMIEYAYELGEEEFSDYVESYHMWATTIADSMVDLLGIKDKLDKENKKHVEDFYNEGIE